MDQLHAFAVAYGYGALLLIGFVEFGALPVGGVTVLLGAGALTGSGYLTFPGVVAAVSTGGLLADLFWFSAARARGEAIVNVACGLSADPRSCVLSVRRQVLRFGPSYLVLAKFLPGTAGLAAAAAGLSPLRAARFMAIDGVALVLWTSLWTGAVRVFAPRIEELIDWIDGRMRLVLPAALAAIALVAFLRFAKSRTHVGRHGGAPDAATIAPDSGA
jgi:membrane protein DedA with SNARE-associated domain